MKKHDATTKVVCGVPPRTISNSNVDGDWVSMSRYDSIMLVYMSDVGVAGKDVTVTLRQARSASGGQAKNVNSGQWYAEQATVAGDALTAIGGDDSGSWTDDGETAALARVEITADQLDVSGGFDFVSVRLRNSTSGAEKVASVSYIMRGARYVRDVPDQPTVLS